MKIAAKSRMDALVVLDAKVSHLNIYYYESKDDDRSISQATRKQQLVELRKTFDSILNVKNEFKGAENTAELNLEGRL